MMNIKKDTVFAKALSSIPEFQFDEKVTQVFDDMIKRSVPGYDTLIQLIGVFASVFVKHKTNVYDLGCSTGVVSGLLSTSLKKADVTIFAVDNSASMIEQCRSNLNKIDNNLAVNCLCSDISVVEIEQASLVILNLTLQFIDVCKRETLLQSVYAGLNENGALVLSEKIVFDDVDLNKNMIELHQAFKKAQGYSELEISQKRASLENFLIPESIQEHIKRLKRVGFKQVFLSYQCLNFVSFLAIK